MPRPARAPAARARSIRASACAFERIDTVFHDRLERLAQRPVSPDIVIVAIDDRSLADVGRWPWGRVVQAELLDRVTAGQPRAVGLDLILTEGDTTDAGGDAYLAAALQRSGRVVLPVVLLDRRGGGQLERVEPVGALGAQAAALAHIHLEIDPDGIVRSTFLREGRAGRWWDQFGVAVLRTGGFALPAELPGQRRSEMASEGSAMADGLWQRDHWLQIPFAGPAGSFTTVSSVDVLRGDVPASTFAGKYVLIGATSAGMGDAYPTPRSAEGELMAGVEISAHVMNALLTGQRIERAGTTQALAFSVVPVALALLALVLLSPTASLLVSAGLLLAVPV
ncbi:MAG: CHASE2 domain-containing protein, partial [Variovorax sp.]